MQLSNSLDKLLDKVLRYRYKNHHITFNHYLCLSVSTITDFLYLLRAKDAEYFIEYRLQTSNKLDDKLFQNIIPKKICKKESCILNSKIFYRILDISNNEKVKIIAKPDAFYNGYPLEIKALSMKNEKLKSFLLDYGKYQAEIYGYVLGTEIAYLIIGTYTFNNKEIFISNISRYKIEVNNEKMDKEIKNLIKDEIFPRIKDKLLIAAGGI